MSATDSQVIMPQLGESIVEGTIVEWKVGPGDQVKRGQILAEVETDKATSEIPAPRDGVVETILHAVGETVDVGTAIMDFAGGDKLSKKVSSDKKVSPPNPPKVALNGSAPSREGRLPSKRLAPRPTDFTGGPMRSSPAVRRLAREHQLDLHAIVGTGAKGRVTKQDVLDTLAAQKAAPPPSPSRPKQTIARSRRTYRPPVYQLKPRDQVVPFSRRRKMVSEHMQFSLETSAHVAAVTEIDMQGVMQARKADLPIAQKAGVHLTVTAYVVQALAKALAEHPKLNATVQEEQLILRADRNVGVAVDTNDGLVVPVVKRADELGLLGIGRAIDELSQKARAGKLTAEDMADGSFTLSNPGREGNLFGISIIRQPEVAIMRMGSVVKRAVVKTIDGEDHIVIRPMMYAALSYDHRVVDGRDGNAFLTRVVRLLTNVKPSLAE